MKRSFDKFLVRLGESGLIDKIEARALSAHVSMRELYEGPDRAPSIAGARRDIYKWLMERGKGLNEVARLFDRAPNGVFKLVRGTGKRK
jgi:hypothetical protein